MMWAFSILICTVIYILISDNAIIQIFAIFEYFLYEIFRSPCSVKHFFFVLGITACPHAVFVFIKFK